MERRYQSLWHRLEYLGVSTDVVRSGIAKAGIPERYKEDAEQETLIQLHMTHAGQGWSDGECVECAKQIAKREAIRMRSYLGFPLSIPKDVFRQRPIVSSCTPDLETIQKQVLDRRGDSVGLDDDGDDCESDTVTQPSCDEWALERRMAGMSNTHKNIAKGVMSGESLTSIAQRLNIQEDSVEHYVARILRVLGRGDLVTTLAIWLCGLVVVVALMAASIEAMAADLGVRSTTYEITEPDMRAVLMGQLAQHDLDAIGKGMQERTEAYTAGFRAIHLPPAEQTATHYVDMSVTVEKDFYVPQMGDDGKLQWTLLAPAGSRFNPLDTVRPVTAFLVIDATSDKQRKLAIEAWKQAPLYIKVLVSAGDPAELGKAIDTAVYRASPWILRRFKVQHEPALIRPGYGEFTPYVAVTALAEPWTIDALGTIDPMRATSIGQAREMQPLAALQNEPETADE